MIDNTHYINATNVDVTGQHINSSTITIEKIRLTNCGTGFPVINYTIVDEGNSSLINGTASVVFAYNGSSPTESFTRTVTSKNAFSVCILPTKESLFADYTATYSAPLYQQRVLTEEDISLSNSTREKELKLLLDADGIFATFALKDTFLNPLSGVKGVVEITTNDTIEVRNTDDAGIVTFFVDPDTAYIFTFSKSGFKTNTFTLRVTSADIITVTLESQVSEQITSFFTGIDYFFEPRDTILNNNTNFTFNFNLTSSFWDITGCSFRLRNESEILSETTCEFNSSISNGLINFNTGNQTIIISEAEYQLNSTANFTVSQSYKVEWTFEGKFSLKNFLDDITNFSAAAFGDFERFLIGVLIILLIVGSLSIQSTEFRNPEILIPITWILVAFFSYLGWFNIPLDTIPDIRGLPVDWLNKWILFVLISLTGGAYLIRKHL